MGLLDKSTARTLEALLLKLPRIGDPDTRQDLVQDVPSGLRDTIPLGSAKAQDIRTIIRLLEEDGAQLEDESWPIVLVIDRAIRMAPERTRTHADLKRLRDSLNVAPSAAGEREEESKPATRAPALITARKPARVAPGFTQPGEVPHELVEALTPGETVRVVALHGMGGVGKTVLALKLAHAVKTHYPDGIIDLEELQPGDEPAPPGALMGAVIRVFQPEARLPDGLAEIAALYREETENRRALLLLDNAASAAQVEPLLDLPEGWGVIMTSRPHLGLHDAHEHHVKALEQDEAVELLRRLLPAGLATDAELGELAKACGGLPLALVVAARVVKVMSLPVGEFADEVEVEPLRHLVDEDESKSVTRVLGTSVTRLRQKDAGLAEKWALLAVFPAPFDRDAAAAVWETDVAAARMILGQLVAVSLVDYDRQEDSYRLHDLLRAYARGEAGTWLRGAQRRHARHYLDVGAQANDLYMSGDEGVLDGLRRFDAAWPHLRAAWEWMRAHTSASARVWVAGMPLRMPHVLDLRLTPRERIPLLEAALAAARKIGNRQGQGAALANLGTAYATLGDARRAIEAYQQALAIHRKISDRRGEGGNLSNLGAAYATLGDARRAIEAYQQALTIHRKIGDRRGEGIDLGNLGAAYDSLGDARRAIDFYQQALVIHRGIGDRRGEGNALANLGNAYDSLGDARRAIDFYQQALVIHRGIGDRRGEGADLTNLGLAYAALGDARRAIEFYQQALVISRGIGDRRGEGLDLGNLGRAHAMLGEGQQAIGFCEQSLAILREVEDRRLQAYALNFLGFAHTAAGEPARAAALHEQALETIRPLGDELAVGRFLVDLGEARRALGETEAAVAALREALAIAQAIGDRRSEAQASWALGTIAAEAGDASTAVPLMEVCVAYEREIGHADAENNAARLEAVRRRAHGVHLSDPAKGEGD